MNNKIKKKQIIIELFGYITHLMIENNLIKSQQVIISLKKFEGYLNNKLGTQLRSVQHIYQQIRAYERENFIKLFDKVASDETNDISIVFIGSGTYRDKFFLNIGLKLAIANGAYDLISYLNEYEKSKRILNIYLCAGTESYYFAKILFQKHIDRINIYTHNLGIIEHYLQNYLHLKKHQYVYTFWKNTPRSIGYNRATRRQL